MADRFQLHASSLESLARCGIAFERRQILGDRRPPSARLVIGTAIHHAVATNLQHKIDTDTLLPVEAVREDARDTLVHEWEKGVAPSEEDLEEGITARDKALDMSVGLAGFHHQNCAPGLNPTHVERSWVLDIEGLNIQLAGRIDIQEFDYVRDTKTSSKSPVKTLADESLQLSVYALAARQIDGVMPENVALDYLVQTPKRGDQKLVTLEARRTEESLMPVLARLEVMDRIIASGNFTPAPVGAWWCASRWCDFHSDCPYAAHPVSVPGSEVK